MKINVVKGTGEQAIYDEEKLRTALKRSGANQGEIDAVVHYLEPLLFDGISTKKIYQLAYSILRKKSHRVAGRYRLKKAIMDLGPTGYPFEKFVGRLFASDGFKTKIGQIIHGNCIQHEVDVVAKKPNKLVMVECKFHSDSTRKSDVRVALYINSRFKDIESKMAKSNENTDAEFKGMVISNTRFSEDAMNFAKCAGLGLISWDYPVGNSLKDWIDRSGLHPITSLQSLKKRDKQRLLEEDIILCREIINHHDTLRKFGFTERMIKKVDQEARLLVG